MNGADTLPRYAIYYAPRAEEPLALAARRWLGRNPETGEERKVPPVPGVPYERLLEIVSDPRLYGFHGTLKAPLTLAEGATERDLLDAVGKLASAERAVEVPPMELAQLSGFLALVPSHQAVALQDLADRCVIEFDEFRRPAGEAELARRRTPGLTQRQDNLLLRWGYPYVLEQWRFHLTLTGRIRDDDEREAVMMELRRRFAGVVECSLTVRDLCIFRQSAAGWPFNVLARFRLGGGRRLATRVWTAA